MTWTPLGLASIVDDVANGIDGRAQPTVLTRDDGASLIYPGMVNGVHGESGSGKTWLALHACVQQLTAGHRVIYVDHEGDPRSIIRRLIDLSIPADTIVRGFHYVQPETPFSDGGAALIETVRTLGASLVVIDSTGEGLALHGANPNADDDVARWFREVPRRIADQGPAVLLIDHTAKARGGELWPIGSQRKRAAINGAQYYIETITPFSRDRAGAAKLTCAKDRHGHYTFGQKVGVLNVTPNDATITITIAAPDPIERTPDGGFRPTVLMEKISRLLGTTGGLSQRAIERDVPGKSEHVRRALDVLITEGHITRSPGPRGANLHHLIRPFPPGTHSTPPQPLDLDRVRVPSKDGDAGRSQIEGLDRVPDAVRTQSGRTHETNHRKDQP